MKPLKDAEDAAVAELEATFAAAAAAVAECDPSPPASAGPMAREGARKAAKVVDYAALSSGQNKQPRAENNSALKAAKAAAVASAETARSALATRIEQRREWTENAGPLTAAEFEAFGRAAVQPGYDYYTKLYRTVGGQMYAFRQALRAATVFDPLKLKVMSLLAAELLVDDLKYFDFPEFTPAFFANLKAELPKLLEHARKPFYWGGACLGPPSTTLLSSAGASAKPQLLQSRLPLRRRRRRCPRRMLSQRSPLWPQSGPKRTSATGSRTRRRRPGAFGSGGWFA